MKENKWERKVNANLKNVVTTVSIHLNAKTSLQCLLVTNLSLVQPLNHYNKYDRQVQKIREEVETF